LVQLTSPRPVELNVAVQATVQNLTVLIGDSIRMIFMPEQESGMVYMDPVQIDQIIMNLVLNARDAMPDGGTLTIATERVSIDEQSSLLSTKAAPGEYLLLSVKDSGVGIDAATLEQIFDPFFTTKDVGKGTGLGLATVYGIVAQNRGFIDVSSQPGIGTVFRIYLPALAD
jgi:signal transduction histidine kinase